MNDFNKFPKLPIGESASKTFLLRNKIQSEKALSKYQKVAEAINAELALQPEDADWIELETVLATIEPKIKSPITAKLFADKRSNVGLEYTAAYQTNIEKAGWELILHNTKYYLVNKDHKERFEKLHPLKSTIKFKKTIEVKKDAQYQKMLDALAKIASGSYDGYITWKDLQQIEGVIEDRAKQTIKAWVAEGRLRETGIKREHVDSYEFNPDFVEKIRDPDEEISDPEEELN